MGEVTYTVPTIGEAVTAACPKVDTALTEIKTQINGKVEAINVKNESLTVEKVAKSGKWVNEGALPEIKKSEKVEKEPSATENALVMVTLVLNNGGGTVTANVLVGGVKIAVVESKEGNPIYAVGAFRVLAGEKWAVEVTAGSGGVVAATSEFAYMKGIV